MTRPLLICLALAATLAACGDAGVKRDPALDRAVQAAEQAGGYRARLFLQADLQGQSLSFDGEVVSAADGGRERVSGSLTQGEEKPFDLTAISVEGSQWVRASNQDLPRGKSWAQAVGGGGAPGTLTPAEFARFLRDAAEVESLGADRVGGREARHYRGRLDPARLGPEAAQRVAAVAGPGGPEVALEVWLGEDDLPVRTTLHVRPPEGVGGGVVITADIEDYGVPVAGIGAPPERLVARPPAGG